MQCIENFGGKMPQMPPPGCAPGHDPPRPPLEPPLWRYHGSVMYVTRQWRSYHENFSFIVT